MRFGSPLWIFLLALIPLLWILLRRRGPRREIFVSSLFLWKKIDSTVSPRDEKFWKKTPLSFYCWAAAIFGIAAALSRPSIFLATPPSVAMLLDRSARMGTQEESGRLRWDRARLEAAKILKSLSADARVLISVFPGGPETAVGSPSETSALIDSLEPTEAPAVLDFEVQKWLASLSPDSFDAGFIFSDRLVLDLPSWVRSLAFGATSKNAGFVALHTSTEGGRFRVHTFVKNFSTVAGDWTVRARSEKAPPHAKALHLPPGQSQAVEFDLSMEGEWTLSLDPEDELSCDNHLFLLPHPPKFQVWFHSGSPPDLRAALEAIPEVELLEGADRLPETSSVNLLIGGDSNPEKIPSVRFPNRESSLAPQSLKINADSPLGKWLNFDGVRIRAAAEIDASSGQILATFQTEEGNEYPLILLRENGLEFAFLLQDSNWPRHPSFPVFWAAFVEQLRGGFGVLGNVLTGRALYIPVEGLQDPRGKVVSDRKNFAPLWTGFYRVDERILFAANLLDAGQSENGGESIRWDGKISWADQGRRKKELADEFLWLALAALCLGTWLERKRHS